MMTIKENFKAFFAGEKFEWIPSNQDLLVFHPKEIGDNVARGMVKEQEDFPKEKFGGDGWFGVKWIYDYHSNGAMEAGTVIDDISQWRDVKFPDLDAYDWEGIREKNKDYLDTDKVIYTTIFTGYFERLISLVGFEEAAVSLIDEDLVEDTKAFFDKLTDFYIDFIGRFKKHYDLGILEFHDDWGSQRAPFMSIETHKEIIAPYIKRIAEACHKLGIVYAQHSCGMIEDLIPNLIETGADTWSGQSCCDKYKLVNLYGDRFKFAVVLDMNELTGEEQIKEEIKKTYDMYKDKKVWFRLMGRTDPGKLEKAFDYLRSLQ